MLSWIRSSIFPMNFFIPALFFPVLYASHHHGSSGTNSSITVNGVATPFNLCTSLDSVTTPTFCWTLDPTTNDTTFGVSVQVPTQGGWFGVAFHPRGKMVPAHAIVILPPTDGSSPAQVQEYTMRNKHQSGVKVTKPGQTLATNLTGNQDPDGTLNMIFTVPGQNLAAFGIPQSTLTSKLIIAFGVQADGMNLLSHTDRGKFKLDLASKVAIMSAKDPSQGRRTLIILIHAILMAVAWYLLVPLATLLGAPLLRARFFSNDKSSNPKFTSFHKWVMFAAVTINVSGILLGIFMIGTNSYMTHFILGCVVGVLSIAQSTLGYLRSLIRPTDLKLTGMRKKRDMYILIHQILGRLVWAMAAVNVFFGLNATSYPSWVRIAAYVVTATAFIPMFIGYVLKYIIGDASSSSSSESSKGNLGTSKNDW